jgi:ferritin-like metal-binding protein YciE
MAKEPKKLEELFHDTLKDIYFAEKKILTTLPKMAKAAQNEELRAAFEKHEAETEEQIGRLEQVFAVIDKKPQAKTCDAIVGITEEGAEIMKEYKGSPALDAGLLAAAQAVEHYEISRYGTLIAWAEELGLEDAVSLLEETLEDRHKIKDEGKRMRSQRRSFWAFRNQAAWALVERRWGSWLLWRRRGGQSGRGFWDPRLWQRRSLETLSVSFVLVLQSGRYNVLS